MATSIYEPLVIHGTNLGRVDRDEFIVSRCAGRKVLHVGCTDWPVTADKLRQGELLHEKLASSAAELHGADLSAEGIRILQNHGMRNLRIADAEELASVFDGASFDVIVAGELLEHLSNAGAALENMAALLSERGELVVSVPNAFSVELILYLIRGREKVHRDHCCYFSPKTLCRLARNNGLEVVALGYTGRKTLPSIKWRLVNAVENRMPQFSRALVAVLCKADSPLERAALRTEILR